MDEEILDLFECTRGEFGEVGRFGIVGAQEAVVAFNGAFLLGAEGGVVDVGDGGVGRTDGDDIGDILVAIVHQEGGGFAVLPEGKRARGDGLGGVPDELLVDIPRAVGEELLDAEVAVVEEEGVGDLRGAILLAVGDAATETVKGHRDDLRPLRPTDRPVLGVVLHRPLARFREHLGLISIVVVLGREVVNGGVLVEVIGGVGLALGDGAVSDIVIGVRDIVCGDELVAGVVAVLLVVDKNTAAAKKIVGVGIYLLLTEYRVNIIRCEHRPYCSSMSNCPFPK